MRQPRRKLEKDRDNTINYIFKKYGGDVRLVKILTCRLTVLETEIYKYQRH